MNRFYCCLSATVILLVSCLSPELDTPISPAPDVLKEQVARAFEEENPSRGIAMIEGARRRYPDIEWDSLWRQGVGLIVDLFEDALEREDWSLAMRYYRSLDALEKEDAISGVSLAELEKRYLNDLILEENPALGLHLLGEGAIDYGAEELASFLTIAQEEGQQGAVEHLEAVIDGEETEREKMQPDDTRKLLKGMATIWVNRGIRIDQGVGLPDRVIGSGFFIDSRGYLLTNYHVISSEVDPSYEGFSRLYIRLPDFPKERIPARVVGWDVLLDLALLKVEYRPDYVFSFMEKELHPGQRIFAIGSPGGLESTITSGIVSATERRLLQIGDTTQIDVPINHGNSGGPLVDEYGHVVGVVFAGIENFEGINFAIPTKWVRLVMDQLYREKAVSHPWLGVAVYEQDEGLEVLYVVPESPAYVSGISPGDIITGIGEFSGESIGDYHYSLLQHQTSELVRLRVQREGEELPIISYLGERPESPFIEALEMDSTERLIYPLFGFSLENAGATLWERRFRISRILTGMIGDETGLSINDPLILQSFKVLEEENVALLQLTIKKRKAGFLETSIQLGAYLDVNYFL